MTTFNDPAGRGLLLRRIGLILLLLLLFLAGAGGYWWYASPSAVLAGQVVASNVHRQPLAGAEISVVGTARSVRTDSQGRFLLKLLPAGAMQVKIVAPGYDDAILPAEMKRGTETRLEIALTASHARSLATRAAAAIAGQVLDSASGQPLAGVRISMSGGKATAVCTASDGRFLFAEFPENKAELEAELPGYRKTTASWLAGARPLSIALTGGASLTGNVVAEGYDRPTAIAGASVRLVSGDRATATDREGRFCLPSLVGGQKEIQVEIAAEGFATRTIAAGLPNEGAVLENVALAGVAALNGSIADQLTGKAIAGACVSLRGTNLKTQTGADGKFALAAVPPGSHLLHVSGDGYRDAEKAATVMVQDNPPLDLVLADAKSLRGSVVREGPDDDATAIAFATLAVKGTDLLAKADAKGRFSLAGLPPETVTLVVKAAGFLPKEVACDPRLDTENVIRLRGDSAVAGRIIDTAYDPPRPIPAATIRLDNTPQATRSNNQGQFDAGGVPSGAARIVVSAPGYVPCEIVQRLHHDAPNQLGDIALAGNSEVQGTVVSEGSGQPVAHAEVRITGTAVVARTDDAGHYCLSGLPPGEFDVAVEAPGYEPVQHREVVASGKNSLKLALKKDAVVTLDDRAPTPQVAEAQGGAGVVGQGRDRVAAIASPAASDAGSPEINPFQGAAAAGPSSGSGGGVGAAGGGSLAAAGSGSGSGAEAKSSWDRLPDDERLKRAVFYIATGKPFSAGRVYMVSIKGNILGSVGLRFAPSGMAIHAKTLDDCGLVLAIPRDFGRIMRIDKSGRAWTILERDPALPHPVDVGVPGGSDEIFVADDAANVLARTQLDGRPAGVFRPKPTSSLDGRGSLDQGMSLAATKDKHVILGAANPPGVYRFACNDRSAPAERCLAGQGGVAADLQSARWAAAQPPNKICLYQAGQMVKQLSLPAGLVHYGSGLMSFSSEDGWLYAACVEKDHPDDGIWLCLCSNVEKNQFERLFQWTAREWTPKDMPNVTLTDQGINAFVVGPWLPWPGAILAGGTTPPRPK